MGLIVQIQSFSISFLYGIFLSLIFNILYNLLFTKYKIINIITNLFFALVIFGLYFLLLYLVNNGVVHVYFLVTLFISFYLYNKLFVKLRVKFKKTRLN